MHIMSISRSLKTEALSMYSLRLSMYIMLMPRISQKTGTRNILYLYYCDLVCIHITVAQHAYYCKKYPERETYYYCDSVCISCLSAFLDKLQKAKDILIIITTAMHSL